jgi:drug/metabolite transporter (DMT)-like permease
MEILLAMGAAVSYGVSDFAGGLLTRKAHVFVVFLLSQLVSSALLVGVVVFSGDPISQSGMGWGAAAGLSGVVGTSLLYQGLAIGRMSVVAPITAVLGAALPVLFGLALGERPGPAALTGIVAGLVAVIVITRAPDPSATEAGVNPHDTVALQVAARSRQAIICAFGSGLGFGLFFILLERSPVDSGTWPLLGTRISYVVVLGLVVAVRGLSARVAAGTGSSLVGLGVVNTLADLLFLLATRSGLLSLVAVITSLYPAVTVGLAGVILHERVTSRQLVGLVVAAVSVALIAVG